MSAPAENTYPVYDPSFQQNDSATPSPVPVAVAPNPTPVFQPQPKLSAGLKFGYGVLGFFLAIIGIVLAWLINADKHPSIMQSAIVSAIVGFVIAIVGVMALYAFMFVGLMTSAMYW